MDKKLIVESLSEVVIYKRLPKYQNLETRLNNEPSFFRITSPTFNDIKYTFGLFL